MKFDEAAQQQAAFDAIEAGGAASHEDFVAAEAVIAGVRAYIDEIDVKVQAYRSGRRLLGVALGADLEPGDAISVSRAEVKAR